jgi:hypothetical protein
MIRPSGGTKQPQCSLQDVMNFHPHFGNQLYRLNLIPWGNSKRMIQRNDHKVTILQHWQDLQWNSGEDLGFYIHVHHIHIKT